MKQPGIELGLLFGKVRSKRWIPACAGMTGFCGGFCCRGVWRGVWLGARAVAHPVGFEAGNGRRGIPPSVLVLGIGTLAHWYRVWGQVSARSGLGSPAVVGAFADFLDDFADKGVKVVGGARCDDPLLADNRFVLPERTGIEKVGFD